MTAGIVMTDKKDRIKQYEYDLWILQQVTPINPDDIDLSWCDSKTRDSIMTIVKDDYYRWKNRVNQLNLILTKLKKDDGDSDG